MRISTDGSLWRAVDETLDRQVSIRVVRPGHRFTADVVDAARRAALVEDARLVRVLDVGEAGGSAYIVSEHLIGRTLEELLVAGPVPAETVRRFVGEAAQALDRASARGLHHLRLSPASLVVASDGTVKVLGTAVEAALAGVEQDDDPVGADRIDAIGLVRLIYAGLTGRWPGPADGPLGPAARMTGRAVPPGELVTGVPRDLDTLCAVTLGADDGGPQSPGELARQLAPWAPVERPTDPRNPSGAEPQRPALDSIDALVALAAEGWSPTRAAASAAAARPTSASPAAQHDEPSASDASAGGANRIMIGSHLAVPGDLGSTSTPAGALPRGLRTGGLAVSHSDGLDDWAMLARNAPAPDRPADAQPLGPFLPPAPVSRPPRDQARFVLAVVAGLVTVGLILAAFSLRGLFKGPDPLVQPAPLIPTATAPGAPGRVGASTSSAGAAPVPQPTSSSPFTSASGSMLPTPSGTPAEISGIQAIDPQGDGDENGSTADRAIDGDASTTWRSARYNTESFGGLKQGLGLYLQLTGNTVKSVTVSISGSAGKAELRTAEGPGLDSSVVVATGQASNGSLVLTPTQPIKSQSLLLWFTELPRLDNGEYRVVVSEITVS